MMLRKFTVMLSSVVVFGAASAPAHAAKLYRWESRNGTVSFTDDAKRVPERYREAAKQIDPNALAGYGRYTPTDAAATEAYTARLNARLEALRAANRTEADTAGRSAAEEPIVVPTQIVEPARRIGRRRAFVMPDGSIRYRYFSSPGPTLTSTPSLPVDPNDPSPVVTEQKRVRVPGQPITQTVTVTRQGHRVLSVIVPHGNYYTLDFGNLSDYEN